MDSTIVLLTLIAYKALLIGIGIWASRRNKSESDYFLGGRALGPWVAGLSYAASTSSAWVLLGFSGFVYVFGVSALWMLPGTWLGYVLVWLWFGPRLRAETVEENHVTLTDFLAARSGGSWRRAIVWTASALIVFCFIFYIAAQFQAAGAAFAAAFDMRVAESVMIGAAIILIYVFLGGFWAASVTDTVQAAIMWLIAIFLPVVAVIAAGGPAGIIQTLQATAPEGYLAWDGGQPFFLFAGFALGIFSVGLGTYGQPQLLNRLMAVKDEKSRIRGFIIAISWGVIVFLGMAALALAGRALVADLGNAENIFYRMTADLLPAALAGVVVAAVLSAVMSTVDSILLAAAGAVAHDLGVTKRWPQRELLVSRLVMSAICVLAVIITLSVPATIFGRVLFAWSALGAAFGPIVAARVAGVEPRAWAVWLSMTVGFTLTVLFSQVFDSGPGQVGERLLPWLPALAIVFLFRQPRGEPAARPSG
ncbi:sodium/proline symporter [Euryhalocaulis caribicus]|uniref:sodium/proline symporter n=1 Tax=Euryhalocaulis caribicus TaxID=1161401 RepID=UPI0003AB137E|nr:sodium/proline symporter [Euryhalocaulis caribicus]